MHQKSLTVVSRHMAVAYLFGDLGQTEVENIYELVSLNHDS